MTFIYKHKTLKAAFKRCIAMLCFIMAFIITLPAQENTNLVVISNIKGVPVQLKRTELKSIFKGERQRWGNGNKILIALMKANTPIGKTTCQKVYEMNADEVKRFWLALVFQGKAAAPTFFNSVNELETFVAENPGAIGIVDAPVATADTQVVMVDGKNKL